MKGCDSELIKQNRQRNTKDKTIARAQHWREGVNESYTDAGSSWIDVVLTEGSSLSKLTETHSENRGLVSVRRWRLERTEAHRMDRCP